MFPSVQFIARCYRYSVKHNIITMFRLWVLQMLASNPPFTRKTESKLNTLTLVERMWSLIWYNICIPILSLYLTSCIIMSYSLCRHLLQQCKVFT